MLGILDHITRYQSAHTYIIVMASVVVAIWIVCHYLAKVNDRENHLLIEEARYARDEARNQVRQLERELAARPPRRK